jgi:ADP-ribose pyrophosphatase YjhB (NUDIX family)
MILKKQVYQPDKKVSPLIGVVLFLISILLLVLTAPFGFIYGLFYAVFTKGFRGIGEYLLKVAISIDQLGNVLMQHLLNVLWVKEGGYKFGNRDETVSSAMGRNRKLKTLTFLGKAADGFLDGIDPDHTLNSIDYYIEPSNEIIDKLAWIHIVDQKVLCVRSKGREKYYLPGGKKEIGESDAQTIFRGIKEELSVELHLPTLKFIGIFEAQANGQKPGILVRMTCYYASYSGRLLPAAEIEELVWLGYGDKEMTSEVDHLIFDFLNEKGLLV